MKIDNSDYDWIEKSPFWPLLSIRGNIKNPRDLFRDGGKFSELSNKEYKDIFDLRFELFNLVEDVEEYKFATEFIKQKYRRV